MCNRAAPPRRTKGARSRHHPPAAHSKKVPGHAKPRPRNVGLSFTAPPLFVPSKVTVATQKLASVLQEGEKSTNIPFRSGEIWEFPDQNDQRKEMVMSLSAWLRPGERRSSGQRLRLLSRDFGSRRRTPKNSKHDA